MAWCVPTMAMLISPRLLGQLWCCIVPRAHWKICHPLLEPNSLSLSYVSSAEPWLPETPARAGEGLAVHLLWRSDLAAMGRGGCGCCSPPGPSRPGCLCTVLLPGEVLVSTGALCSCCWLFQSLESCNCSGVFFGLVFFFFESQVH